MRTGVIIAGGFSTRFEGGDKAVADLAGDPMVRRVADRLAPAVDALVVNCRTEQVQGIEAALDGYEHPVTVAEDPDPDEGPMAGIMTGLRAVDSEYAAVVACDMPFVDPAFVAYLFERAAGHDAAVPRPDEWFQTTQAVYRAVPMADACADALARGEHKIIEPLFTLDYVVVEADEIDAHTPTDTFRNVNTREELQEAERVIEGED
jgi:molybdopterin-guanine dinucleotide biosynthesis protein A